MMQENIYCPERALLAVLTKPMKVCTALITVFGLTCATRMGYFGTRKILIPDRGGSNHFRKHLLCDTLTVGWPHNGTLYFSFRPMDFVVVKQ